MIVQPVVRDAATAEFFAGTSRGKFLLRRSPQTGEVLGPSTQQDGADNTDLDWFEASGLGSVLSWAFVPRRDPDTGATVELVIGLIELDEGPWWWTQLVDLDRKSLREGLRVRVVFCKSGLDDDHETVPMFTSASGQ